MAEDGLHVIDGALHVVEPRRLWEDSLDPKFRGRKAKVLWDNCARLYNLTSR